MKQILALACLLVLAACGFKPLYATSGPGKALFQQVVVEAPNDATGYTLTDALYQHFGGQGSGAYRLDLVPSLTRTGLGVSSSNIAARFEMDLSVTYVMTRTADNVVITRGVERATASFDAPTSPYASVAAQTDAETRAARLVAEQIWRAVAVKLPTDVK